MEFHATVRCARYETTCSARSGEPLSHMNPRVFGSVLHGTDRDGSDLDLLVDALPGATLLDLGSLQDDLESLLGIHVDLLTPGDLPPKFRAKVLAEAQPV